MSQNYNNKHNGGRFMELCSTLDRIKISIPDLKNRLCSFIVNREYTYQPCRLYGYCNIDYKCRLWDGKKDGRVQLPGYIINWFLDNQEANNIYEWRVSLNDKNRPGPGAKVTLTWLVCYVWDVYPDQTLAGWESFECSHICLCAGLGGGKNNQLVCTWAGHLTWESSSDNQSRGYNNCLNICHCGCGYTLCYLYKIHKPYCL
jgi:hypothetical protein